MKGWAVAVAAVATLGGFGAGLHAMAQGRSGPLSGSGGPIDISADELEVVDADRRAVWRGNVEAKQGESRMRTPVLNVFFAPKAGAPAASASNSGGGVAGQNWGAIERMEAEGPVYYVTPTQSARGDHGTYIAASDTITLTGNVVVSQEKNVLQGEKLVIETKTGRSTMVSNAQGRNASGRVRGVFYPNSSKPAAAGQAATPAPAARP
jgi:lipopolysaccharide export system protein LptA